MPDIKISKCKNLLVKVFIIGYSLRGESIVVLFIDKEYQNNVLYSIVIDCFTYKKLNKTEEILNTYGISQIDMLCWSHPDLDHTKGIDIIINKFCKETTKIMLPQGLNGKEYDVIDYNKGDIEIVEKVIKLNHRKKKVQLTASVTPTLYQPMEELNFIDYPDKIPVNIHALSPHSTLINERIGGDKTIEKNELSTVLFVEVGNFYKFVFCSDIENYSIDNIRQSCFDDAVLVKIPHHTSMTSNNLLSMLINRDNNMLGCTTVYTTHKLPNPLLLNEYKSICSQVHTTGTKKGNTINYGIVEYTFDFYDKKAITIKCHGHAERVN
ncbi:hypothetical protein AAH030_12455 [Phocaeicola vulgatus]|uniref:hypothetical protein n=1 Tax=Phocaeicola vulgatus TaxID=821 RepID=UPI0039B4037E